MMILPRRRTSYLVLGVQFAWLLAPSGVDAGDAGDRVLVTRIAGRCAQFGQGFVDVGAGVCGRVSNQLRVYVYGGTKSASVTPAETAPANPWRVNGTSSAVMRSDTMVPGAEVTHLRVRGNLDSFAPLR